MLHDVVLPRNYPNGRSIKKVKYDDIVTHDIRH